MSSILRGALRHKDFHGVTAVATGSACNSKETELSHVIEAIQIPENYASGTIRITLGMDNTEDQMYTMADQIQRIIGV